MFVSLKVNNLNVRAPVLNSDSEDVQQTLIYKLH